MNLSDSVYGKEANCKGSRFIKERIADIIAYIALIIIVLLLIPVIIAAGFILIIWTLADKALSFIDSKNTH